MNTKKETEALNKLVKICNLNISKSSEVLNYVKSRGMDEDVIQKYNIGAFPQNIDILKKHVSEEVLLKKFILKSPYFSDFKDFHKLIIPIINEYGDAVGIAGRCIMSSEDNKKIGIPKYKNSSFEKRNTLFGLNNSYHEILKNDRVYIVEGYLDQIAMYKNGIYNSVAMGGTAFSKGHLLKLLRITTNLFFIFDRDEAGVASAGRIIKRFDDPLINLSFLRGPEGYKDVDEFFSENSRMDFYKKFKKFKP